MAETIYTIALPAQVSHGEANDDPWQFTDEELEYLYGQWQPRYPMPVLRQST